MTSDDYRAAKASHGGYWAAMYCDRVRRERAAGIAPIPVGLWALMCAVYGWQQWPDGYGVNRNETNQPTNQTN